ncbi:hypothetical protein SBY92_004640 [Candida maltosa Xu316]
MTITKYQRGDLIEGWNDCPTPAKKLIVTHADLDDKDIATQDVADLIHKVFALDISLPERELNHYQIKLINNVEKMTPPSSDLIFIYHNQNDETPAVKNELKNQIVEYMMVHEGVSSWCSALKKIVSKL